MTCKETRKLLSCYLDGKLPPAPRRRVTRHLQSCHTCAGELDSLNEISGLLSSLPRPQLTVDLAPAVVARASTNTLTGRLAAGFYSLNQYRAAVGRQLTRAVVVVALIALAATVPGRGPSDLLISLPARVTGLSATIAGRVISGLADLQEYIDERRSPAPKRASAHSPERSLLSLENSTEVASLTSPYNSRR